MAKYSDDLANWLLESGYSTCFFVAGGNIMHLIESLSHRLEMIPVIHEVAAAIASDYFNEASSADGFSRGRALALVTVGPGVTNTVTAVAGAHIDGRELLILGGQVKTTDLKSLGERQRGIQEVDGIPIFFSITKVCLRIEKRLNEEKFKALISQSRQDRKGPVYIEICLDVQGSTSSNQLDEKNYQELALSTTRSNALSDCQIERVLESILKSERPLILLGGGVPRNDKDLLMKLNSFEIPIATTWHGADRISSESPLYAGRPNLFGQRWANIVLQQSDLILVLGSSLGMQQTGFNLKEFAPLAKIFHVDLDTNSFKTRQIENLIPIQSSLKDFVDELTKSFAERLISRSSVWKDWLTFIQTVRKKLPVVEEATDLSDGYVNPFRYIELLSSIAPSELNFIPCSSGGSYTCSMQVFEQMSGHLIISSRGLGSMGIGLAGAIGAAKSNGKLTWLIEGDGGILQNIQELATISQMKLPIKVVIFNNNGYASIRSTQKKYFGGNYVGCDSATGLGQPNFELLAQAFGLSFHKINSILDENEVRKVMLGDEPSIVEVIVSPAQPYLPKIESKLNKDGSMVSSSLHEMFPVLPPEVSNSVLKYLIRHGEKHE
jgi:acetolactate synthase-1/2/3 large subunit